ncbi:MAG: alpha/beta hydrolase [Candidatus Puniceispirillaceae bacterium]
MSRGPDAFPAARAAGLPMLGGEDLHVTSDAFRVRGHVWRSGGDGLPVLICPGFGEFCEKYSWLAADLHARGHSVLIIDWPGQGRSGTLARHDFGIHIDSFEQYLAAMDALVEAAGLSTGRIVVFGHSMGGHLALRLTARYAGRVEGTIAMSPMMVPRPRPVWAVRMLARFLVMAGRARHQAPGSAPRRCEDERNFFERNHLTRCQKGYGQRFSWYEDAPELWRYGASVGWVAAAYRSCAETSLNPAFLRSIRSPVLALTGSGETIVRWSAFRSMFRWIPECAHHEYEGARHELLYETEDVRHDLRRRIDAFLDGLQGRTRTAGGG